jgi:hypothetical protein
VSDDDLTTVREILTGCRQEGEPFDEAWPRALQALPPLQGRGGAAVERKHVREALGCTRDEWARAYERRPGNALGIEALR